MEVNDLIDQQDAASSYTKEFTLWPEKWSSYEREHDCDWECVEFLRENIDCIPEDSGVYNFVVEPGIACHPACSHVMYVGETSCLKRRYRQYLNEKENISGRPKIIRLLNKWEGYINFYYITVESETRERVQDEMITAFVPPFNDSLTSEISGVTDAF